MESCKKNKVLERRQLQRMYESVDEDGDGMLSPKEINGFLGRLGMDSIPLHELDRMVSSFSKTQQGILTLEEFAKFYDCLCKHHEYDSSDNVSFMRAMEKAFNVYDENKDGFISAQEIHKVLSSLGFLENCLLSHCQDMITKYDTNFDGLIDFSEFKSMMMASSYSLPSSTQA